MAHLYYAESAGSSWQIGQNLEIDGSEARHAVKVARLRTGEEILIGDGQGTLAQCKVTQTDSTRFLAEILAIDQEESPKVPVTLVQALAKGDRAERAVELATEFGVSRIIPWQAERSVSRWNNPEKQQRGSQKWQRVAVEAAKQSLRGYIPTVTPLATSKTLVSMRTAEPAELLIILEPGAEASLREVLHQENARDVQRTGVTVVVGPEGGLTEAEIAEFTNAGARSARLGQHVLRTSSAGAAALAVIHTTNHTW